MDPCKIMTLPVEIHDLILSFLPFYSHPSASQVCRLWETILSTRAHIAARYLPLHPNDTDHIPGLHLLIDGSGRLQLIIKDKELIRLEYIVQKGRSMDVKKSPMLDDELFSSYFEYTELWPSSNTFNACLESMDPFESREWELGCMWKVGKGWKVRDIVGAFLKGMVEEYMDDEEVGRESWLEYEVSLTHRYSKDDDDGVFDRFTLVGMVEDIESD
ncbi:hypothetical protein TWF281_009055 [Arthrobotrys megalospora]